MVSGLLSSDYAAGLRGFADSTSVCWQRTGRDPSRPPPDRVRGRLCGPFLRPAATAYGARLARILRAKAKSKGQSQQPKPTAKADSQSQSPSSALFAPSMVLTLRAGYRRSRSIPSSANGTFSRAREKEVRTPTSTQHFTGAGNRFVLAAQMRSDRSPYAVG